MSTEQTTRTPRVVIISGISGAGRRTAAHAMEDLGWYVVDNLPPVMLGALVDEIGANDIDRLAVVLDVRSRIMFDTLGVAVAALDERGIDPAIVFLEASDETIVRRQESSRRPMPLQQGGHLLDAVALVLLAKEDVEAEDVAVVLDGLVHVLDGETNVVDARKGIIVEVLHASILALPAKPESVGVGIRHDIDRPCPEHLCDAVRSAVHTSGPCDDVRSARRCEWCGRDRSVKNGFAVSPSPSPGHVPSKEP